MLYTKVMVSPTPPLALPVAGRSTKKRRLGVATAYFFVPILAFVFTSIPYVNRLTPFMAILLLALGLGFKFLPWKLPRNFFVLLWMFFIMTLVGSSGWFFSPFFFTLYLAAIALGFIYVPSVAITFTVGLLLIFASSIGEVSPTADFLTLLSLLSVIPITIALRRTFLLVQQERKGILILESDERSVGGTALEAVLSNQVNKLAIILRQPVTYIRQGLALLKDNALTPEEYPEVIQRMSRAADEVFTLIKEFESEKTRNILVSRKKKEPDHDKKN